ncbi:MAG: hypothetical protein IJ912_04800 [Fibrobacter sp.]|nr:hypothetical protein [Fibrobacter sp.]MBR6834133.1 hypothetical protein [Fibrobacter sp.]
MKNKWYEVLGAGLLSVSAMYLCTALVVTGCSVDGDSLDALDANETSEVVNPSSEEAASSSEKSEKAEEPSDTEDASNSADAVKSEKPADSEKPETSEAEEPVESGDVTAPEEPTEPNKAEPEEKTDPAETTEPSEEKTEQAEPSNSEEKIEPIESAEPESVELNNAKEWEIIRDSVTSVVENNSIQYLHETRSFRLDRSDKILRLDEYRMPKDDFVAEYQYDGYDQHLTDRLYEDEILWEGFNWTNLNKPECRFKAGLDSILVGTNWPEIYVEMYAIYDVRYFCQSLGLEGNLSIWIPVRYRAKQD